MTENFIPNCGGPLNPEAVKAGLTWYAEGRKWVPHQALGAVVSSPPAGWRDLFGRGERYAYTPGLKVVSIVYDWKLFN